MLPSRTPQQTRRFLETARTRWKTATAASEKQRKRELDDLRFLVDHWPSDLRTSRAGQAAQAGMPPVPARPCIQVDKLSEPINRVLNQERQADIGVEVVAADDFAELGIELDPTEIELREGLVRRIQRSSEAQDARTWAFKRGTQAGQGYYLVNTRFLPGKSWDKEVYIHRIYNQDGVRLDPAHEQPTGKDANWEFIGAWVPWEVYKAQHPSASKKTRDLNRISEATDAQFADLSEEKPEWVNITEGAKAVYVVDYWYCELTTRKTMRLEDGTGVWLDEYKGEVPEDADIRDVVERKIHYAQLDGINDFALSDEEWEGPDMPIVKIVGEELQPYDSERRIQGMVRPARDSQFGLDAMISKQVETVALTPIPALHVDPVAIEGYESWYAMLNTRTLPFAPSRTYDEQGRHLAPPSRLNADPNLLPIAQSIALFSQSIQDTTATSDPALGRTDPSVKSARHAERLIDEAQLSTSQYLDNYTRSLQYEGEVVNNLLYAIYGTRPGRLVGILTGEGDKERRRVNPKTTPEQAAMQQRNQKIAEQVGVLTKDASFNVAISLTKNSTHKRNAETTFIGGLIESYPLFMTWFGDLFFKNQDGPGHQQMAERAKVMLDPKIVQYLASKERGQQPIPADVQQKLAEQEERLKLAEVAMKELAEEARGKKIEAQTKIETAQIQASVDAKKVGADLVKARMDNATKIAIAHINASTKGVALDAHAQEEAEALGHEMLQNELDRQHERDMAASTQDHEVGLADAQNEASELEANAGRDHETAMTQAQLDAQAEQNESGEATT